jgi:hypothetical protein
MRRTALPSVRRGYRCNQKFFFSSLFGPIAIIGSRKLISVSCHVGNYVDIP